MVPSYYISPDRTFPPSQPPLWHSALNFLTYTSIHVQDWTKILKSLYSWVVYLFLRHMPFIFTGSVNLIGARCSVFVGLLLIFSPHLSILSFHLFNLSYTLHLSKFFMVLLKHPLAYTRVLAGAWINHLLWRQDGLEKEWLYLGVRRYQQTTIDPPVAALCLPVRVSPERNVNKWITYSDKKTK